MSKPTIITISGKAGHGKDSFALSLKSDLEKYGKKVFIIHYADYLKFLVKTVHNWNGEKDEKGRSLLQETGGLMRKIDPLFFIKRLEEIVFLAKDDYDYVLIPDARFPNELNYFETIYRTYNVLVKRLYIPEDKVVALTSVQKKDVSETSVDNSSFHFTYVFSGEDLEDVYKYSKELSSVLEN